MSRKVDRTRSRSTTRSCRASAPTAPRRESAEPRSGRTPRRSDPLRAGIRRRRERGRAGVETITMWGRYAGVLGLDMDRCLGKGLVWLDIRRRTKRSGRGARVPLLKTLARLRLARLSVFRRGTRSPLRQSPAGRRSLHSLRPSEAQQVGGRPHLLEASRACGDPEPGRPFGARMSALLPGNVAKRRKCNPIPAPHRGAASSGASPKGERLNSRGGVPTSAPR
jgi:hypothetical protein